jgi:hypothetical protein
MKSKISKSTVKIIRERASRGDTYGDIAHDIGLAEKHVLNIALGKSWSNLNEEYPPAAPKRHRKLSDADVIEIRKRRHNGETLESIGASYRVTYMTIYRAAVGITHRRLNIASPPVNSGRRTDRGEIFHEFFMDTERELIAFMAKNSNTSDLPVVAKLWDIVTTVRKDLLYLD